MFASSWEGAGIEVVDRAGRAGYRTRGIRDVGGCDAGLPSAFALTATMKSKAPTLPNLKASSSHQRSNSNKRSPSMRYSICPKITLNVSIKFAWPEWVREYKMRFISPGLSILCIEHDERLDQIKKISKGIGMATAS
jgi:hypothetical protein